MAATATIGGSSVNLHRTGPVTDYTSLDFAALKQDLIAYAQATFSDRWTDFNPTQFAVVFLDIQCYLGDLMTFYMNTGLREQTITTAQRRQSVYNLAKPLNYTLRSASQAGGVLSVTTIIINHPVNVLTSHQFAAGDVIFQPIQNYVLNGTGGVNNGDGTYTTPIEIIEGQEFSNVVLGTSDGGREQVFTLPQKPMIDGTLVAKVNAIAWTEVSSFGQSISTDQHYRVETDDNDDTRIIFGDNINGKIPPSGQVVTATWKVGGGVRGRVGEDTITDVLTPIVGIDSVTNPNAMTGGDDQETLIQAKSSIPLAINSGDRAVSISDYVVISQQASTSVAKAVAMEHPDAKVIELYIAPSGGGLPSLALKNTVETYVNARRMAGRRVRMLDPTYIKVVATVDVFVDRSVNRDTFKQLVQSLFITPSATDAQNGLLDFANVGFGARADDGTPQLTLQRAYDILDTLLTAGMQTARFSRFQNVPILRPLGVVRGDGTLTFVTLNNAARKKRHWRIKFTSSTTYQVYERIIGNSTGLSSNELVDDRLLIDFGWPDFVINPNSRQRTTFQVDESLSLLVNSKSFFMDTAVEGPFATFLSVASVGDPYYVESAASPATGTVGVAYTPTTDPAIQWLINSGPTAFVSGDEYIIRVTEGAGNIILHDDEIPLLDLANVSLPSVPDPLVINVLSAF